VIGQEQMTKRAWPVASLLICGALNQPWRGHFEASRMRSATSCNSRLGRQVLAGMFGFVLFPKKGSLHLVSKPPLVRVSSILHECKFPQTKEFVAIKFLRQLLDGRRPAGHPAILTGRRWKDQSLPTKISCGDTLVFAAGWL